MARRNEEIGETPEKTEGAETPGSTPSTETDKAASILHDEVGPPSVSADRELSGWLMGLSVLKRANAKGVPMATGAALIYEAGSFPNKWGPMPLPEAEGGGSQSGVKAMCQCFKVSFRRDEDIRRIELELGGAMNDEALAFPRPVKLRISGEKPVAEARNPEVRCQGSGLKIGAPFSGQ